MRFSKVAEAQEAADKLEAGLAKTEGADRAKLLDKLIDAKQKLLGYDPRPAKASTSGPRKSSPWTPTTRPA